MSYQVVCFGETLFDVLDDTSTPGGAPFNVAYHLKNAGVNSYLISSVGNDSYGRELLEILRGWNIDTDGISISDTCSTGKALVVKAANGQPEYELVHPVAWDFIEWQGSFADIIRNASAFVFGSLVSRNKASYDTLMRCLEYSSLNVFDINIRPPHYSQPIIESLLQRTHILKLNNAELLLLNSWYGAMDMSEAEQVRNIRARFDIPEVIVTKGEQGASYYGTDISLHQEAIAVTEADTVGSGDAFLAGFLSRRLDGYSQLEACLHEAAKKGAYVASRSGACPSYDGYQ